MDLVRKYLDLCLRGFAEPATAVRGGRGGRRYRTLHKIPTTHTPDRFSELDYSAEKSVTVPKIAPLEQPRRDAAENASFGYLTPSSSWSNRALKIGPGAYGVGLAQVLVQ